MLSPTFRVSDRSILLSDDGKTFGAGIDHPHDKRASEDLEGAALSFVKSHLNISDKDVSFKSGFSGEAAAHAYVRQQIVSVHHKLVDGNGRILIGNQDGVPVANAVANVAFNHAGKVVAFGSSFVKPSKLVHPMKMSFIFLTLGL